MLKFQHLPIVTGSGEVVITNWMNTNCLHTSVVRIMSSKTKKTYKEK